MARLDDDIEAIVTASMAAVDKMGDMSALSDYGCLTIAQCCALVQFFRPASDDRQATHAMAAYLRLAMLDVSSGNLEVRHPESHLPWSQYLRMIESGMYGDEGGAAPMVDAGWLVDLGEAASWFEAIGVPVDLSDVEADLYSALIQQHPTVETLPSPGSQREWMRLAPAYADEACVAAARQLTKEEAAAKVAARFKVEKIYGSRGKELSGSTIVRQALAGWQPKRR